jgi:hypothetical protein
MMADVVEWRPTWIFVKVGFQSTGLFIVYVCKLVVYLGRILHAPGGEAVGGGRERESRFRGDLEI